MTYDQARKLLKSFPIDDGHDWDRHCIHVGETAYKLALALEPYTSVDAAKARLMGLVHDYGRNVSQCPFRHAYEGYKLFKSMGEEELAHICVCHSNGTYRIEDLDEYGLKPEDFFVRTTEEKLVFMSDNMEHHGSLVRQNIRLADVISRYRAKNPDFLPVLESKIIEFSAFDQEIKNICGKGVYEILGI